jgi:hypothetical protein
MRILLATVLAGCGLAFAPARVDAAPLDCPPFCDRIPPSAWIAPTSIPLHDAYRWPELGAVATPVTAPLFRFEEACGSPPVDDARAYAVASRAVVTSPDGLWHLQAQVMHWRGEAWRAGETATEVYDAGVAALRRCQLTAPHTSPSLTTAEPERKAAVISDAAGPTLREYLLVDPRSGTISELALWSTGRQARPWPAVADTDVLDAMAAPLCVAYIDSCR